MNWSGVSGRLQEAMIILATSPACFPAVLETSSLVRRCEVPCRVRTWTQIRSISE